MKYGSTIGILFLQLARKSSILIIKQLSSSLYSMADMNNSDADIWAAIYPGMSDEEIGKRITSTRKLFKSETRMLVTFVE